MALPADHYRSYLLGLSAQALVSMVPVFPVQVAPLDLYPEKLGEGEGAPRGSGLGQGLVQEAA